MGEGGRCKCPKGSTVQVGYANVLWYYKNGSTKMPNSPVYNYKGSISCPGDVDHPYCAKNPMCLKDPCNPGGYFDGTRCKCSNGYKLTQDLSSPVGFSCQKLDLNFCGVRGETYQINSSSGYPKIDKTDIACLNCKSPYKQNKTCFNTPRS